MAIQDAPNHFSIMPTPWAQQEFGTMQAWLDSYNDANSAPHFYTELLELICTRN